MNFGRHVPFEYYSNGAMSVMSRMPSEAVDGKESQMVHHRHEVDSRMNCSSPPPYDRKRVMTPPEPPVSNESG